jgi:hypothetical protein
MREAAVFAKQLNSLRENFGENIKNLVIFAKIKYVAKMIKGIFVLTLVRGRNGH